MPALARDGNPVPVNGHEAGDAEPGPRAEHGHRLSGDASATAHRPYVLIGQPRERQRESGEVVDELQVVQPQAAPGVVDRQVPGRVGQPEPVACHRPRDRHARR
jgi:hypothetical protein